MKKLARTLMVLSLALLLASPLLAAEKAKKGKKKAGKKAKQAVVVRVPKSIQLSDEQQKAVDALNAEYAPKMAELQKQINSVVGPEQRKAAQNAVKEARAAGKKGKQLRAAREAALNLTAEQKSQIEGAQKELLALRKEAHGKLLGLLTDEQKAGLKQGGKKGKGKKSKKADK